MQKIRKMVIWLFICCLMTAQMVYADKQTGQTAQTAYAAEQTKRTADAAAQAEQTKQTADAAEQAEQTMQAEYAAGQTQAPDPGDVNGDGCITASDALLVLQYVVKLQTFDAMQMTLADVNQDEKVAADDALRILMKVVRLIDDYADADKVIASDGTAAPSVCGALHVEGTKLCGENGKTVQLKGVSTHGIAWFPDYINEECFRQLRKEWKANVVRLAMYTAEYNGYCSSGDRTWLKELIDKGVTYATKQDLYVIIDWHILSDSNPNTNKEDAKAFFAEMSKKYAGHNNVLYEICNEPNGGTTWSDIKQYAEELIPVIRQNDKDAVILVGTPNWSQYVDQAAADPIKGYDNIMYTLHYYAATHKESLRSTLETAVKGGLPVFVSEYGICDASGSGAIDEASANAWVGLLNHYNISYVAWNLSNKAETSSIIKSSCTKTNGFTTNDLSESGKWLYKTLTGGNPGTYTPQGGSGTESGPDTGSTGTVTGPSVSVDAGSMTPALLVVNSWTSGNTTCYQYSLSLQNNTGAAISGWNVKLTFGGTPKVDSSWNGNFSVNGKTITITPMDYNASAAAGASVSDIGFIVSIN